MRRGPIGHAVLDPPCPSLLLCTDGIHRQVDPTHLTAALGPVRDPQATAARLVAAAESAGNDNATVLLVHAAPAISGAVGNPARLARLASPAPVPVSVGPLSTAGSAGATKPSQMSIEQPDAAARPEPTSGMNRLDVRPVPRR